MGTDDPRVVAGLAAQASLLDAMQASGARRIGWKAGFGAPAAMAAMGLDAPLVGFLTDRTLLPVGATPVRLDGWNRPMAEAEVAVVLAADLGPDETPDTLLAAVGAIAPAIELADLDLAPTPDVVAEILAGDIFHRHVLVGASRPTPGGWPGRDLRAEVRHVADDGQETRTVIEDVEVGPGPAAAVLAACARGAAMVGPGLRRGDVVILGSMLPPVPVMPGERFALTLDGMPGIEVALAR